MSGNATSVESFSAPFPHKLQLSCRTGDILETPLPFPSSSKTTETMDPPPPIGTSLSLTLQKKETGVLGPGGGGDFPPRNDFARF